MTSPGQELETHIEKALGGLKDFQRATVDVVHRRLFHEGQKNMLIADEVGLGKTIVAKGVIATELKARRQAGVQEPFKVTYICSNQVIAGENLRKLNFFPEQEVVHSSERRIAFLAYEPSVKKNIYTETLSLNTLTPGTSFQVSNSLGTQQERTILYALLCHDKSFHDRRTGLACLVRGGVRRPLQQWKDGLDWRSSRRSLRADLPGRFWDMAAERPLSETCPKTVEVLGYSSETSMCEAAYDLAGMLHPDNEQEYRSACNELVVALRRVLIDACLGYLDADLFILDEFQRFRSLIDPNNEDEESKIARRVFQQDQSKVLLLSATPFKAFTGDLDHANGEDHFRDFRTVFSFLTGSDGNLLEEYERHRGALYSQLLNLKPGTPVPTVHRERLEVILRRVMCRTERHSVSADPNEMILDRWKDDRLAFDEGDVRNFIAADQLALALIRADKQGRRAIGTPVEYCKSAPYPFSFLDGYILKKQLEDLKIIPDVRKVLRSNRDAWLDMNQINLYQLRIGGQRTDGPCCTHARLAQLVDAALGKHGDRMLWIPPSLPYYPLEGAFKESGGFSKTLVFSSWVMVPRMISTLLSYEVERRTIGNPETRGEQEQAKRIYFQGKNRHPARQFTFPAQSEGSSHQHMSNFCILYPSLTLAELISPRELLAMGKRLDEIRKQIAGEIEGKIHRADLKRFEHHDGTPDRWYWAAPLLLDRERLEVRTILEAWFENLGTNGVSGEAGRKEHYHTFQQAFLEPGAIGLGPMPVELPYILADMVLGSPAVVGLRSLITQFGSRPPTVSDLNDSFSLAGEFLNLYNKPESITAVRLATDPDMSYWQQTLRYGCDGCIQAVFDEYLHLLQGQGGGRKDVVERFRNTINISTASVNVDGFESFMAEKTLKMRCHYAVEFGNQRIETEEGEQRASNIRANFNSPFRPFVLATTSIGQEGLDFHQYCRRIMHWNLPGNPIDLEQREGRINRYKGLVIRQQLAARYGHRLKELRSEGDPWDELFELADMNERVNTGKCELVPYWNVEIDEIRIERMVPMYPYSKDEQRLERILKTLAIYRLAFGQPRQAELVEHLLGKNFSANEITEICTKLMINLSPVSYQDLQPNQKED